MNDATIKERERHMVGLSPTARRKVEVLADEEHRSIPAQIEAMADAELRRRQIDPRTLEPAKESAA